MSNHPPNHNKSTDQPGKKPCPARRRPRRRRKRGQPETRLSLPWAATDGPPAHPAAARRLAPLLFTVLLAMATNHPAIADPARTSTRRQPTCDRTCELPPLATDATPRAPDACAHHHAKRPGQRHTRPLINALKRLRSAFADRRAARTELRQHRRTPCHTPPRSHPHHRPRIHILRRHQST